MGKRYEKTFPEEDTQVENKLMKRCSTSVAVREMQIGITVRYHYTPIKMTKVNNRQHQMSEWTWKNWITHTSVMGMQNGPVTLKTVWLFLKN